MKTLLEMHGKTITLADNYTSHYPLFTYNGQFQGVDQVRSAICHFEGLTWIDCR